MKKRLLILLVVILALISANAQTTNVTATIQFPSGQVFANGTFTADFLPPGGIINQNLYKLNGLPFPYSVSGSLSSGGVFSVTLTDDHVIRPQGGRWQFTICTVSNELLCYKSVQDVFGAAIDLSALINAQIVNGQIPPLSLPRIYQDSEVTTDPLGGNIYFNFTSKKARLWDGSTWTDIGAGGGGGVPTGVANGSALVSNGIGNPPVYQTKPIYDTRDWMICDGNGVIGTDASAGMNALLAAIGTQEATIHVIGTTTSSATCRIGNTFFPSNVTLDFSGGGAIQLISSTTPIGGGSYVSGTSVECGAGVNCSLPAFTVTGGNTILVAEAPYPGFTFKTTRVTDDCGNFYIHVFQSLAGQPRNQGLWIASNVNGGSCTITATASGSLTTHMMLAAQIAGMGPVTSVDSSASNNNNGTTMSSDSTTTLAGAFLFAFGGQPFVAETCTAGAGYTQPAGLAGQSTNGFICAEYNNVSAGGSTSATQNITVDPSPGSWVYSLVSLKPGNATATIWGGIVDPDQHKIFYNADSATGDGVIDFTGSSITQDVYPEWWGASFNATPSVNTIALQAAIWAAFGGGLTQARTNASGLSNYNRPLRIGTMYQINDELKMYHVIGFKMYGINRLGSGIQQTATNKRVIDGQNIAYGEFSNFTFTTQVSQNTSSPLVDIDADSNHQTDLKPQFIDFNHIGFVGNGVASIGVLIAKSGGNAQGSNIYCRDCSSVSFTEAAWQIGTHSILATNALDIGYSGDIQGSTKFGIAVYGGGYVSFGGSVEEASMENGFSTQTGFDMYCEATQGPCSMDYMRSESRRLISGPEIVLKRSRMINQAAFPPPGVTFPVGSLMTGSGVGGDGAFYTVTNNSSAFNGVGTPSAPFRASSGTITTVVDTNQTVAGATTIKLFNAPCCETVTQAVTGATGTLLNAPASTGTISGSLTTGSTFTFNDNAQQAVTGVTCVVQAGNTTTLFNCNNFSGTADGTHIWTDTTSGATFTPSGVPVFSAATMLITAATGAPDNTHDWVGGVSTAHFTPTGVPVNQANYTVNGFTGMVVSILSGKSAGCYGVITSNTANSITFTAGWLTRYYKLGCSSTDTTSSFLVEPNWNHGTVVDGGMTMVYLNENAIDCQTSFGSTSSCNPGGRIEDAVIAGGKIRAFNLSIYNTLVYRQDWYDNAGGDEPQHCCEQVSNWDVKILPNVGGTVVPYQGAFLQSWTLPSITGVSFSGPLQQRLGSKVLVWDIGNIGTNNPPANTSANSVWIGGRTDNGAGTDATRNILEFGGMLGRGAPLPTVANGFNTTDQNGTDTDITGGPSTGVGVGGAINFWTSNPGTTGTTVNGGIKRAFVNSSGLFIGGTGTGAVAGQLGLNGSTSGTATITAPPVAGTANNPISFSNQISTSGYQLINGTVPSGATGIFNSAVQNIVAFSNGISWLLGNQNLVQTIKPLVMAGGNKLFVSSNFTTAANTNLQTITGLQFIHTASNAINWNVHCALSYSQATATAAVAFGIQASTNNPNNIFMVGHMQVTAGPPSTYVDAVLPTLNTTTATNIVSATPGAITTNYVVYLDGTLELPTGANTINFMVSTATSGDAVTVLRGSYCDVF